VYQFIVQFLRFFLAPIFELHEVRQVRGSAVSKPWADGSARDISLSAPTVVCLMSLHSVTAVCHCRVDYCELHGNVCVLLATH
jgi:hypothetical protein